MIFESVFLSVTLTCHQLVVETKRCYMKILSIQAFYQQHHQKDKNILIKEYIS